MVSKVKIRLFLILKLLLLQYSFVSASECFLFISAKKKFDKSALDQQIKPILSRYLSIRFKDVGVAGIKLDNKQLEKECQITVGVNKSKKMYSISINSKNLSFPLNGVVETRMAMPIGIRFALLRILYRDLDAPKQYEICQQYRNQLEEECPQFPKTLLVYQKRSETDFEKYAKEAKSYIRNELEELILEIEGIQFLKTDLVTDKVNEDVLLSIFESSNLKNIILFSLEGELLKKQSSLWAGFADISLNLILYQYTSGEVTKIGEYDTKMVRLPLDEWKNRSKYKRDMFLNAASKLTMKWDDTSIIEFLNKIKI